MDEIFIVMSGEYSDRCIEGCFSTKEKAEEFIDSGECTARMRVIRKCLDEPVERKVRLWEVYIPESSEHKTIAHTIEFSHIYEDCIQYSDGFRIMGMVQHEGYFLYVKSDSMKKAIGVANKRLEDVKYSNNRYPLLRKKVIAGKLTGDREYIKLGGDYPVYHIPSGKIQLMDNEKIIIKGEDLK